MKKIINKLFGIILALTITFGVMPSIRVSASVDAFSGIEFYTLEMRDSEEAQAGTSGYATTMGTTVWNDYLIVPVYFSNPVNADDRNKIFIYDLSEGTPEYVTEYNMVDLGLAHRTGDYASQDIISGLCLTDEYMIVTYYINTSWPNNYTTNMVYIYENPLTGVSPRETLTRVKINDTEIYSGTVSTFITDKQFFNTWNDGAVNLHTIGNYLISFAQEHSITNERNFYVTDISGDTLAVNTISEYETFVTSNGTLSSRFLDVFFDGNYAYVLTALAGATADDATTNLALFTVDFTNPLNPEVLGDITFDSNYLYSDLSNLGGYITIEEGYAYVSTCGINNRGATYNIDRKVHLFTLKKTGNSFEFIKDFALDSTMTLSGGFGAVGVVDDIAVCLNGPTGSNYSTYLQFNETKDEIVSYEKGGKINTDASANSNGVVRYGSRLFFGLLRTGVSGATDSNKGVVDVFDVLNKGIEWHNAENIENKSYDNIFAEFENPYIENGVNTVYVSGTNNGEETSLQLILALYDESGNLVTTSVSEKESVEAGGEIDISHEIDLSEIENAADGVLKAFLWDGDTIEPIAKTISPIHTSFEFTLDEGAYTSAGVYDMNDKLVRTLWSVVYYDEGTYIETWDGKDDQGVIVPDGDYKITVLSSNVEYDTFVDVIGNTSDCSSWDTYVGSYNAIFDMGYDPRTERIYYCSNHVEGAYGLRYMTADNINRTEALMDGFYANMTATRVAVDGNRIYWGSEEMSFSGAETDKLSRAFIYATDEDSRPYTFEHGEHVVSKWNDANNCILYPSAINATVINKWSAEGEFQYNRISGLEVQQNGDFLFSSYLDMNKVYVNDKNTGAVLDTLEINAPGAIAITGDNEDILYIAYKNEDGEYKVASYSVADSGKLEKITEMEAVFDTVLGMAISPNGEKIVVIESGNKNRFQVLDTTTEEVLASFGSGESYAEDTLVKDDKLTFADEVWLYPNLYEHTFVEFMDDDEFLFGDSGNARVYKMNISGETPQIVDRNLFRSCNYNCQAVLNDEVRITAGSIEYEVDYEKMEEYANNKDNYAFENAWSLKRNYREHLSKYYPEVDADAIEGVFMDAVTLSNGYTYSRMKHTDGNFYLYKEKDGIISATGILMNRTDIMEDGSVYESINQGNTATFKKRDFLGFDENANPIWGEAYTVVSITPNEHEPKDNSAYNQVAITDSDKFIILEASGPDFSKLDTAGKNMHLGGIDISNGYGNSYQWTAAPRSLRRYGGPFQKDGYFYISGVDYTTRHPLTVGNNIVFCWHGNCAANIFYHFRDNGLAVGVYGSMFHEHGGSYDIWSGAVDEVLPCNTFSLSVVQNPYDSDSAYIFQPSEGAAGGIFATRVSGLDSISEQSVDVKRKTALTSGIKYTLYDNDQINSAEVIKRGITNTFEIPYIAANDGKSVKFEGYIVPTETKTYRFAIETDGYVKFYVENELAIKGTGSQAKKIDLEEGKMYSFRLEVMPNEGQLSYLKVGYEQSGKYDYLTENMVLCQHPDIDDGNEVNLLEGFSYGEAFESGIYGWDTAIYGGNGYSYLNISTNVWNYRHDADTDILMNACAAATSEARDEVILDRDLGEIESDRWQIDMDIRFWGYINRTNEAYGRAAIGTIIEVLDKDEKVIGNFYFGGGATNDPDFRACVNNTEILAYPKVQYGSSLTSIEQISKLMDVPFNLPHTLKFTAQEDGTILAEYCGEVMEVNIVDETADWQSPAKVRFSRYNNWHGIGYSSNLNITRFNLIKDINS